MNNITLSDFNKAAIKKISNSISTGEEFSLASIAISELLDIPWGEACDALRDAITSCGRDSKTIWNLFINHYMEGWDVY